MLPVTPEGVEDVVFIVDRSCLNFLLDYSASRRVGFAHRNNRAVGGATLHLQLPLQFITREDA